MNCHHDYVLNWTDQGTYTYLCSLCHSVDDKPPLEADLFQKLEQILCRIDKADSKKDLARYQEQKRWILDRILPVYSQEEVDKLEQLVGDVDRALIGDTGYWVVNEPTKINPDFLKNHPQNTQIYGLEEDISELIDQIKESGWIKRLTINLEGEVLGGNRRLLAIKALKELGQSIPLVDIEIKRFDSKEEELRFLVLDNASREKSPMQRLQEAKALRTIRELILKKFKQKGEELTLEERLFLNRWEQTKQVLQEKKGTTIKSRDVLAKQVGLGSGANLQKALVVGDVFDFLVFRGRNQEAKGLEGKLNNGIDSAYKFAQDWLTENPIDWVYNGDPIGDKASGTSVKVVYSMLSTNPDKCWIDFGDGYPIEVFRVDLFLPPPPLPEQKPLKLKVGDRVQDKFSQTKFEGEIIRIENGRYVVDWDNQARTAGLTDKDIVAKPKAIKFELGKFYSDGNSVGLCTFIGGCGDIKICWLGMGQNLAPKDYLEEFNQENLPSLTVYKFDPANPPNYVNKKLEVGDQVALANKVRDHDSIMLVVDVGAYITVETKDHSRIEMSEKNLILLQHKGFSVGDSVTIAEGLRFPLSAEGIGVITGLYKSCCNLKFGEAFFRLHYDWIKSCQLEIPLSDVSLISSVDESTDPPTLIEEPQVTLGEAILGFTRLEEVSSFLSVCTRNELENAVKDLWQVLKIKS